MSQINELVKLATVIANGAIGKSTFWQGADVVISDKVNSSRSDNFYPDPRIVVTPYAGELSWLFEQLRDLFMKNEDYGFHKEEIFGRFGNIANRFAAKNPDASSRDTLLAVMHEAFAISEEIADGDFLTLYVTSGNQILDDLIHESEKSGFLSIEDTKNWFYSKGIIE